MDTDNSANKMSIDSLYCPHIQPLNSTNLSSLNCFFLRSFNFANSLAGAGDPGVSSLRCAELVLANLDV